MGKFDFQIDGTEFLKSLDQYENALATGMKDALKQCGLSVERGAKWRCPHDTGHLMRSIKTDFSQIDSFEVSVGTNVEYAVYVEYGTYKQPAQPFLRPAYNTQVTKLQKKLNEVFGGK